MRCASSLILTSVNTWKNPDNKGNYMGCATSDVGCTCISGKQYVKEVVGKVASVVILGTASIETIAYTALTAISLIFYRYTDIPYKFSMNLLESSSFTIIWTLYEQVHINPTHEAFAKQKTHEAFSREKLSHNWFFGHFFPHLFRHEDQKTMIRCLIPNSTESQRQRCAQDSRKWTNFLNRFRIWEAGHREIIYMKEEINEEDLLEDALALTWLH